MVVDGYDAPQVLSLLGKRWQERVQHGQACERSSLRSLAASTSSFDGVLLEPTSRELGGIIYGFASLRKMITEQACQAQPVSPVSASTAAAIAAVAAHRIAAASDAIVASPPQPSAPNPSAAVSGPASSPRVSGSQAGTERARARRAAAAAVPARDEL